MKYLLLIFLILNSALAIETDNRRFIQVQAKDKFERSTIVNLGVSIEAIRSDSIWGIATPKAIGNLKNKGIKILGDFSIQTARGGHDTGFGTTGFPAADARYHDFFEMTSAIKGLQNKYPDMVRVISIGKTIQARDIWALHINTSSDALATSKSGKPGAIYVGNHHAREHLSAEIPYMYADYLLKNRESPEVKTLLETRDIWIIPMLNADGVEFDISTSNYKVWRKNRRDNKDGTFGVDLNRNYSFKWGTGGSDKETDSEIYMGPEPFSEPETIAFRDFVKSQPNAKVLLSFHTFSELVLYPWGNTHDSISNVKVHDVFEKMAKTMAGWNGYKPQQSSDLYIASGDTTDWAYGELGIFAFTFELSPSSMGGGGGFYPGAGVIDKVFAANLKPCLYLLQVADDPYKVSNKQPSGFLKNYVGPTNPVL